MTAAGVMVTDPHCAMHGTPRFTFNVARPKVITDLIAVDDTGVVANYIRRLEARLAALEHERDELRAELTGTLSEAFQAIPACYDTPADHYREMARRLVEDRDVQKHRARHAEAALLSLQTAVRDFQCEMASQADSSMAVGWGVVSVATVSGWAKGLAALLPDPAGTTAPKDHEDTAARGDGEQLTDRPRTAPTERR